MAWGKRLFWTLGGLGVISLGLAGGAWIVWERGTAPITSEAGETVTPVRLTIEPGTSGRQVGYQLAAAGVIRSPYLWEAWLRLRSTPISPQAGTYDLDPAVGMVAIAQQLQQGKGVMAQFTIPEGWRLQQMATYFEAQEWFEAEDFLAVVTEAWAERLSPTRYPWLPPEAPSLEGFLFPDTYTLALDQRTPVAVADLMLRRFGQVAIPLWEARDTEAIDLTFNEWVTLASIVEKEAVLGSERAKIAGVFHNRLRLEMTLGADPTVEYALNIRQTPERRLTFAEVRTPSPYNTYINAGLPPTAIASPGRASLEATLAPEETEELYFVARYDGSHIFSRTLDEHYAAQRRVIEGQRLEALPTD